MALEDDLKDSIRTSLDRDYKVLSERGGEFISLHEQRYSKKQICSARRKLKGSEGELRKILEGFIAEKERKLANSQTRNNLPYETVNVIAGYNSETETLEVLFPIKKGEKGLLRDKLYAQNLVLSEKSLVEEKASSPYGDMLFRRYRMGGGSQEMESAYAQINALSKLNEFEIAKVKVNIINIGSLLLRTATSKERGAAPGQGPEKLYNIKEVAERLKVKRPTVGFYLHKSNIRLHGEKVGRKWMVSETALQKFIAQYSEKGRPIKATRQA